jgi:ribose transport system permease protein
MNRLVSRTKAALSQLVTSAIISSRYMPVWIAIVVLVLAAALFAPGTISRASFGAVLPLTSFLAIAALGQMLVIMTGGIDLSVPGTLTLTALVIVGVAGGDDKRLPIALVTALAVAALVGLLNGLLVGVLKLNALIVTLAVGQLANGAANAYARSIANESAVPAALSQWATQRILGAGWIFWAGLIVALGISILLTYTTFGRRFQAVGANTLAAWIAGIRVSAYIVFAYIGGALLYGLCGILLASFIRSPSLTMGTPYLLGPIAAVVIGGASLKGGLASPASTWIAAFFLTLLSQMLRVLNLDTSWQFVVFGAAIIAGMVVSGDRIITVVENLLGSSLRLRSLQKPGTGS